jgi:hypothetical protein
VPVIGVRSLSVITHTHILKSARWFIAIFQNNSSRFSEFTSEHRLLVQIPLPALISRSLAQALKLSPASQHGRSSDNQQQHGRVDRKRNKAEEAEVDDNYDNNYH